MTNKPRLDKNKAFKSYAGFFSEWSRVVFVRLGEGQAAATSSQTSDITSGQSNGSRHQVRCRIPDPASVLGTRCFLSAAGGQSVLQLPQSPQSQNVVLV